jgi:hypothetical protein
MIRIIILFLFAGFCNILYSQSQHPPGIKWKVIKTPHFNVIAPENIEEKQIETARLLEYIQKPVSYSMSIPEKKLNIFLFNQTTISNGYVTLAPTYSAYYTTPFQDASAVGGADWFQTLALHEYRHYIQFNKLNNGLTYIGSSLFGDYGHAILMNWSVPQWFFEGDAICSETALSAGGRGRLPSFTKDIRALELENKRYSYDVAYLGSYKTYFPNHYYLGYILSSDIRIKYGYENWNRALDRSSKISIWPYAFGGSLGRYAGGRMNKTYRQALDTYDSAWTEQNQKQIVTKFELIEPSRRTYSNYEYPFLLEDGSVICTKSGFDDAPKLIKISNNEETILTSINPLDRVHSNGKQVVWSSYTSHARWGEKGYSDIILFDLQLNRKKRITSKQKLFAPAISGDGKLIAAVEYTDAMHCSLVILSAETGIMLKKVLIPDNQFIRMPSWSADQNSIIFTITQGQEIAIAVCDLKNEAIRYITPFETNNATAPIFYNNYIVYNSPELGVDAIVALDTITNKKYVVASGKYGVYDPEISLTSNHLVFKDYSTQGYNIGKLSMNSTEWVPVEDCANVRDNRFENLVLQEGRGNIFSTYNTDSVVDYKVSKYRPLLKSIKIHSWAPYPVNNGVGFAVLSNDFLNTTAISAGIEYFPSAQANRGYMNLSFAKYYPVFDVSVSYGRKYESFEDTVNNTSLTGLNEKAVSAGITLPFNLSRTVWERYLELSTSFNYLDQNYTEANKDNSITPNNFLFSAIYGGITFINYKQSSKRDINPVFGQELSAHTWHTPFEGKPNGSKQSVLGKAYFPALLKHHSITLEAAYEQNNGEYRGGLYSIGTDIEFVRGYEKPFADTYRNLKAIYTLPLFYPDFSLGPILYLKRMHTSLFYDYGEAIANAEINYYQSVGFDLNFEFNPLRQIMLPLSVGFRYSYLLEKQSGVFEFLLLGTAF